MAMSFAHGAVQWLAADAAATNYVVSGLGFQPKAIRFYWFGLGSSTDTASEATHSRRGLGFATSTSDRRCVGSQDQDAAGSMVCTSGYRTDCVAMTLTSTPAADGLLDITAFGADGFTLTVDDQAPVNITVFWEAFGGDDITDAATGEIAEPAATGVQSYTAGAGFQPNVVMFAGVQATGAAQTAARNDSGLQVGFSTSEYVSGGIVVVGNNDDGSANADTDGNIANGLSTAMVTVAGGAVNAWSDQFAATATGFNLRWMARATTGRKTIFLAIKGGSWKLGKLDIAGNTLNATATVSGLAFQPKGVSFFGRMSDDTGTGATAQDRIALGTATGTSSRRSQGHLSEDGTGSAEIDLAIEYDQCLVYPSTAGAVQTAYDISQWNSDGFQLIVDVAGGVASEDIAYLTFGDAPIGRIFKLAGEGGGLAGSSRGLAG